MRKLERKISPVGKGCNCRESDQETFYHNAVELEKILAVPCPIHGGRHLALVSWVPAGMPLRAEDRQLCICPPCPAREYLEGRRGPLTESEQETECDSWEQQLSEEGSAVFHQDQVKVRSLRRLYERARRQQNV